MKITREYKGKIAHILANDKIAEQFSINFVDSFMKDQRKSFAFVVYHVKDDITLLHFKSLDTQIDFDSAMKAIKKDIENDSISANDGELRKVLKDPNVSTAKFLIEFINSEE